MSAVELYEFTFYSTVWRYTSADAPQEHGGKVYAVLPGLSRGDTEQSGDASRTEHKVTAPIGVGPAALFATGAPDGVVRLKVLRLEDGGANVVWQGRVLGCEFAGITATLTCEPVFTTIKAPGLRRMFTPSCPHDFCDRHCLPPDSNGHYSEPNTAVAAGCGHVFEPGQYFHSGAASAEYPPENIWDENTGSYGEVSAPAEELDWVRYKSGEWTEDAGGCVHTFTREQSLGSEAGVLRFQSVEEEWWECPDLQRRRIVIQGYETPDGVAHYTGSETLFNDTPPSGRLPAPAWEDPAGLPDPDAEGFGPVQYAPEGGVYRAGIRLAAPAELDLAAVFPPQAVGETIRLFVQHSDDGASWTRAMLAAAPGGELLDGGLAAELPAWGGSWLGLRLRPGQGAHDRWAVASAEPFGLAGLRFFSPGPYQDHHCSPLAGTLSVAGTETAGHPASNVLDADPATFCEITGEACRLVLDLGSARDVAAALFVKPVGAAPCRMQLDWSDDGALWRATNVALDTNLTGTKTFLPCADFGAHRWWSVLGVGGAVRLAGWRLFFRGRGLGPDEPRPFTSWPDGSLWELDGSVLAVEGATLRVSGLSSKPDGFFSKGLLLSTSAGAREIVSHAGEAVVLRRALPGLSAGDPVTLRAGCDKTKETCDARGNIANFGGWPFIPWKNPMTGDPVC